MYCFIRETSSEFKSDLCPICLDSLGTKYVFHQNGGEKHPVHETCLLLFFRRCEQNRNCPTCKKTIYARIIDSVDASNAIENPTHSVRGALSEMSIQSEIRVIANRGDISELRRIFDQSNESRRYIGDALIIATSRQNIELIQYLLENHYIPYHAIDTSYQLASRMGNLEMEGLIQYYLDMRSRFDSLNFRNQIVLSVILFCFYQQNS